MSTPVRQRKNTTVKGHKLGGLGSTNPKRHRVSTLLEDPEQSLSDSIPVEVIDLYKDLRYDEQSSCLCLIAPPPRLPSRIVSVRRAKKLTTTAKVPKAAAPPSRLLPEREKATPVSSFEQEPMQLARTNQALPVHVRHDYSLSRFRERDLASQRKALENWANSRQRSIGLKRLLTQKQSRPAKSLLQSRPLVLPPLQNHRGPSLGDSSDFPQWTQYERSYLNDAFFLMPPYLGQEKESLFSALTWTQRQFYKPPLSIARPPLREDDLLARGEAELAAEQLQPPRNRLEALERLYVQGAGLVAEESPMNCSEEQELGEDLQSQIHASLSSFYMPNRHSKPRSLESHDCGLRLDSPYFVRTDVPAFKLDRFTYVWAQPNLQAIVEIGVVCNANETGYTDIRLANVGCCVIRYSWRHLPHEDNFNNGRFRTSPFHFNSSNGVLLPEQRVSLQVQFRVNYPGRWTESWFLQTTPCVGPGRRGEIPLNLWGHALEVDVFLTERLRMEKTLEKSAVQRMSEQDVYNLVKWLPIRTRRDLLEKRVPPIPDSRGADDVAVFLRQNQGLNLHYHSTPMTQLLAAHIYLSPHGNVDGGESSGDVDADLPRELLVHLDNLLHFKVNSIAPANAASNGAKFLRKETMVPSGSLKSSPNSASSGKRDAKAADTNPLETPPTVDKFSTPRADVSVHELYRRSHALTEGDERKEKKESLLRGVNLAVLSMSIKTFAPPMRHYKRVLLRETLVQLCDSIARAEWTLRRQLGLLDSSRFGKLSTFPYESPTFSVTPAESDKPKKQRSAGGGKLGVAAPSRRVSESRMRANPPSATPAPPPTLDSAPAEPEEPPIDWDAAVPSQYRQKLRLIVSCRLASALESLLPILTFDGYHMDLLHPRQTE